jgi:hypothetical protein
MNVSLRLKGFLAYCLSKPDKWQFHVTQLVSVLKEGRDAIYSIIEEGVESGYIEKSQKKGADGRFFSTDYIIHETSIKKMLPLRDFPEVEKPLVESPTLVRNNSSKKDKINTTLPSKVANEKPSENGGGEKEIPKNTQQQEQPKEKESYSALFFTNSRGVKVQVFESDIYRYFLKSNFSTEIISKAIEESKMTKESVSHPMKYIEGICFRIQKNTISSKSYGKIEDREEKRRQKEEEYNKKLEEHRKQPKGKINVGIRK